MSGTDRASRETTLARTFVQISDTLVQDFDIADLFDRLTTACVDVMGAGAAGLMLVDSQGALQLMASSSAQMRALELFEMSYGEGPCLEAFARGVPVAADLRDAAAAARWPRFTVHARDLGYVGVQALPMRLRADTIGALNVFHEREIRLDEHDTAIAQALADLATIAILQRRNLAHSEELAIQLQTALNDRIVIEQVKGLLAERGGIDVDEAFALLRDFCRSSRLPLTRTSRELINSERDPDDVLAQRWPASP